MNKNKKKNLEAVMGKINKKFGNNSIAVMKDIEEELKIKFYKTPSYEINIALDGGVGVGKVVEFYGNPGCGKTSLALEIIAKNQRENPDFTAAWLETERSLDFDYMTTLGIDIDRLIIIQQEEELTAESCMDILRSLMSSGEINMIVLNSCAALCPQKEVEDDLEKQNIALTARLLSKFLRVSTASLGKNKCSLILINQVRTNLGTNSKYVTTTTTGGLAIPFYAAQRVELRKERVEASDPIDEDSGVKIRCRIIKNRLAKGNPYKICHYYAKYGIGIDSVLELGTVLVKEKIVSQGGAWIKYVDKAGTVLPIKTSEKEYNGKWNGIKAFSIDIKEDPELRDFFEKLLNKKLAMGRCGKVLDLDEIKKLQEEEDKISKSIKEIDKEAIENNEDNGE